MYSGNDDQTFYFMDHNVPGIYRVASTSSPWKWKGVSATLQSGRYNLLYQRGRHMRPFGSRGTALISVQLCINIYLRAHHVHTNPRWRRPSLIQISAARTRGFAWGTCRVQTVSCESVRKWRCPWHPLCTVAASAGRSRLYSWPCAAGRPCFCRSVACLLLPDPGMAGRQGQTGPHPSWPQWIWTRWGAAWKKKHRIHQ